MTLIRRFFILCILILFAQMAFSKSNENAYFQKGERVCFVGNSITNNGEFHHNILLYYITRFPEKEVTFFNCGISGDITESILYRMDGDILVNNPTTVVLMIGMNDVKRGLYTTHATTNSDTILLRQKAIDRYKINLEKILNIFIEKKIKVILQTPSIYDQTATLPSINNFGSNDALKICADFVREMGHKYNFPIVDYWEVLNKMNTELQQNDKTSTIIGNDRVHPGNSGHFVMSYEFLKSQKLSKYVSYIRIDAKKRTSDSTINTTIDNLLISDQKIQFSVKGNSLPFPTVDNQNVGLKIVPFTDDLNKEILKVSGLELSTYKLYIDDVIIGNFSNKDFEKGINLSELKNTPQYKQALQVRSILTELWKIETILRSVKFIEFCVDLKPFADKTNPDAVIEYLQPIIEKRNSNFHSTKFKAYIEHKKNEAVLNAKSDELRKKAYEAAQPQKYTYQLIAE